MSWNPRDIPVERPSSFDEVGKRVFLYPSKVKGHYKNLRNIFYFFLLILFLVLPWTNFQGEQTILLDISQRRFVFFGHVFFAHDGPLIFFPLIIASIGLGFITSVWGRVWCGWACPQTVFLESLFRRVDYWVEGNHSQRLKLDKEPFGLKKAYKKTLKWFLFLVICSHISHSFTAYFVGAQKLFWITTAPPTEHWGLFLFVQILTVILLFNFGWFREQFCIIMCPYGRFQSVLMGKRSLAILYDEERGEPRRRPKLKDHGDCVDCYKCVSVCPMGIDIRRGLQMECIACTACIDACDEVMEKVKKPKGLIRYTSLAQLEGKVSKKLNSRSLTYLILLFLATSAFVLLVMSRKAVDLKVIRAIEAPYSVSGDIVINHFRLVVVNQGQGSILIKPPKLLAGEFIGPGVPLSLKPGDHKRVHFFIKVNKKEFADKKRLELRLDFPAVKEGKEVQWIEKKIKILSP